MLPPPVHTGFVSILLAVVAGRRSHALAARAFPRLAVILGVALGPDPALAARCAGIVSRWSNHATVDVGFGHGVPDAVLTSCSLAYSAQAGTSSFAIGGNEAGFALSALAGAGQAVHAGLVPVAQAVCQGGRGTEAKGHAADRHASSGNGAAAAHGVANSGLALV